MQLSLSISLFLEKILYFGRIVCIIQKLVFIFVPETNKNNIMAVLNIRNSKTLGLVDRYLSDGYLLSGITVHRVRSLRSVPRDGFVSFSENSFGDSVVEISSSDSFSSDCHYYAVIRLIKPIDLPF